GLRLLSRRRGLCRGRPSAPSTADPGTWSGPGRLSLGQLLIRKQGGVFGVEVVIVPAGGAVEGRGAAVVAGKKPVRVDRLLVRILAGTSVMVFGSTARVASEPFGPPGQSPGDLVGHVDVEREVSDGAPRQVRADEKRVRVAIVVQFGEARHGGGHALPAAVA